MTEHDVVAGGAAPVSDDELEAVLAACRVLVAVSVRSLATVEQTVDPVHFRVLVVVASRRQASLADVAEGSGLGMSTASRTCDRRVGQGLLSRTEDPTNRRQIRLTLTTAGTRIVREVTERRRAALRPLLGGLPRDRRAELVRVLEEFAAAGGEIAERDLWAMGWPMPTLPTLPTLPPPTLPPTAAGASRPPEED